MDLQGFTWRSIKTKVVFATLGIFVACIWTLTFYASRSLREDMERLLGEQQFSMVSLVAHQVNHEFGERIRSLEQLALQATTAMHAGPGKMQALLNRWNDLYDRFNGGAFATDNTGTVIAALPLSDERIGINLMGQSSLSTTLRTGKAVIGEPSINPCTPYSSEPAIIISVPLWNHRGEIIGALGGVINMTESNFLDRITRSHYGKSGTYLLIVPQQRLIATATDKQRVMEALPPPGVNALLDRFLLGEEGVGVTNNRFRQDIHAAAKNVPLAGWMVVSQMLASEAYAPIREMQRRMVLASLVLTLLAGCLVWFLLRRQLSPLFSAAQELTAMATTAQPPQPLPIVRHDEIGQLIGGFNRLLETLNQREALLTKIFDTSSVGIFLISPEGRITRANQRMYELFGWSESTLIGCQYIELLHPDEHEAGQLSMDQLLSCQSGSVDLDRRYRRRDQTTFWGHLSGRSFRDADKTRHGIVGVIADIDQRKQAETRLFLAASVFSHAREGITITSADGLIIDVNESFTRITGYLREEVLGKNPRVLKSNHHGPEFYEAMWRDLLANDYWHGEIWNRRKSGDLYPELLTISAVRNEQRVIQHFVALFTDITPMKEQEEKLRSMAHFDMLTLLPNRVLLADRMQQAMAQAQRRKQPMAVVCLDLDGFKAVNDTYGHKTGDQLLVALSRRMKAALREGDTLARLGGDEFIAVLSDLDDSDACLPILNRLLSAASQPMAVDERVLHVSASLGVTFYPQGEEADADQLMRQADQAMYEAKLSGKNRYQIFDTEQHRHARNTHESIEDIRRALLSGELTLYYQPTVNMRTGVVLGAEALLRWQHPERGLIPPAHFLPVIENHVLAIELGEWVIETALKQVEAWRRCGLDLSVSVNVGARQLQHPDFVARVREILAAHPALTPECLEIEILETSALKDLASVSQVIEACQEFGLRFALDDFGTGYSSLAYLKRLPVSQIKIDQDFVRDMLSDPDDLSILDGIISLSKAFRRKVIAEGVETVEHGTILLQLGCELAQGYGIAKAMPGNRFVDWLATWQPDPAWQGIRPVNRDKLPLLFALAEHRTWFMSMESYFSGQSDLIPADRNQCRFKQRIDGPTREIHADHADFQALEAVHQRLHDTADELCQLCRAGQREQAAIRLDELRRDRDELLERMRRLTQNPD